MIAKQGKQTPVLKLNAYNKHSVDGAAQDRAIVIRDRAVAARVAQQDQLNLSRQSMSKASVATAQDVTMSSGDQQPSSETAQRNSGGHATDIGHSHSKPPREPAPQPEHSQRLSQKQSKSKAEPVDLSPEDRHHAELEAAIVYYRDLIELKLRRGETLTDGDELYTLLERACDRYERHLEQFMSVEEIAKALA